MIIMILMLQKHCRGTLYEVLPETVWQASITVIATIFITIINIGIFVDLVHGNVVVYSRAICD